jgi:hypothetical protein
MWSVKAGSGVSVTLAGVALQCARSGQDVLLVDLHGSQAAVFGRTPPKVGLAELTGQSSLSGTSSEFGHESRDSLRRVETRLADRLSLVVGGTAGTSGLLDDRNLGHVVDRLRMDGRLVLIDLGLLGSPTSPGRMLLRMVDRSIAVTRSCRLALGSWAEETTRPSGVVVVREARRGWSAPEVARLIGGPLVAVVDSTPAVACAVDRGAFERAPKRFAKQTRAIAEWL